MAVISKKPIKKGPGLPPILGGTPNPLAGVSPNPAGNRNSAFPKTGAVLPFPNPNQPLADLAAPPGGAPPAAPSVVGGVTAGLAGGLPPVITGGQDKGGVTVQAGPAAEPSTEETDEQKLARLQKQYAILQMAGENDPNYQPRAGVAVQLRFLEEQIASLFSRIHGGQGGGGVLPPVTPPAGPVAKPSGTTEPPPEQPAGLVAKPTGTTEPPPVPPSEEGPEPDLKEVLDRAIRAKNISGPNFEALLVAHQRTHKGADLAKVRAQARAYIAAQQAAVDRREGVKKQADVLTTIGNKYKDQLGGKNPAVAMDQLTPEQISALANAQGSKLTDSDYQALKDNWIKGHQGQQWPVFDSNTRAGGLDAQSNIFNPPLPPPPRPDDTASAELMKTYLAGLQASATLPKTADEAYTWLQKPLEPPPGLVQTDLGWANADGSPPTPTQMTALNRYIGRLNTQDTDREAAYRLIAARDGIDAANAARQKTFENEQRLQEQRDKAAQERAVTADERAATEGVIAARRLEDITIRAEERARLTKIAQEGRDAAKRIQERASGGAAAGAGATVTYREGLKGFSRVPTTLDEAKMWLGQTLAEPPGLRFDETTRQWVDESGNLPTGDRAQAVQDYEFQQSQYAQNRKKADGIIQSYADIDDAQRKVDSAQAALQRALGTKDVLEQVELAYLKDKSDLEFKQAQTKHQKMLTFVELTNNPAMAARLKALGLLDQFNQDTGLDIRVPDKVGRDKMFSMIPSLGDWSKMNPQQQLDALEMLSAKTGWMPEELAALMSETAGAPGGRRGGGVSESTVGRAR